MATSFNALKFQDTSRTPTTGTATPLYPAVIHGLSPTNPRCADVLNALPGMAAPAPASTAGLDPIKLHMQAVNCLSRCKATLMANEPLYLFELEDLAAAQQAIESLRALDLTPEG